MTHSCPKWNQVKDLSNSKLAKFLLSNKDELPWYLQQLRKRELMHDRQNVALDKQNTTHTKSSSFLKKDIKKFSKEIAGINYEIKELTKIKNKLADENDGLKDKNGHLEQEIIILKKILAALEKEKSRK
jgi:predicted  nucleic acid-binding Zn-ribbon protein